MRALVRAGRDAVEGLASRAGRDACAPLRNRRALALCAVLAALVAGTQGTEDAVANGDTRTIDIVHEHTKESASITFKRDGRYDSAALQQLNWLLRDWRIDEPTKMDPRLFDVVWEARRAVGSNGPIHVVSAYRSPGTNAMLRRRSKMVAEHSQHMLGKAMDFWLEDVSIDQVRAVGMRMQRGGVGWYPHAGTPFTHLDVGSVRSWPRMGYDQLARLFPDGKTVHMPASGGPMPRYEEAKAEILARGGSVAGYTQVASADEIPTGGGKSLWQMLFGGGDDEDSSYYGLNNGGTGRTKPAPAATRLASAASAPAMGEDAGTRSAMAYAAPRPDAADPLRTSLFRSSTATRTVPLRGNADQPAPTTEPQAPAAEAPASVAPAAVAVAPPARTADAVLAKAVAAMPLPPRRPDALANFATAHGLDAEAPANVPLPPSRRLMLASADGTIMPAAMAPAPVAALTARPKDGERAAADRAKPDLDLADARSHLRALFVAAAASSPPGRAAPVKVAAARSADPGPALARELLAPTSDSAARFVRRGATEPLPAGRFTATR